MDILLIRPPRPPKAITIGEFMFSEPLGLEAVYRVLKQDHELLLIDMMVERSDIEKVLKKYQPRCVGITSLCIDVETILTLASRIKAVNPGIQIVVGGTQAQLRPHSFTSPNIDYVMTRSTAAGISELFSDLVAGKTPGAIDGVQSKKEGFAVPKQLQFNEYLIPDRSSTQRYRHHYSYFGYKPSALLQTSQGCSKCCSFCLRWRIEGAVERHQDMSAICRQIADIDEETIMIVDNDFLCDGGRLETLCDYLKEKRIRKNFICYSSVHSVLANKDSVERFARYGLKAALVGYESHNSKELSAYNKKCTVTDSKRASEILRGCGIDVWASFIMHPDWSHEDFHSLRKYIRILQPEVSSLTPLTPFPGLPYFDTFRDRLLVDEQEYTKWSFGQVTIRPGKMTLQAYYLEILKTNLYINLFMNNAMYLVRKFGWKALFRIAHGSLKLTYRYLTLLIEEKGTG
ncbi:B12-binding domain-containing radical SAM protein [Desulfopila sp. IMCC35008]|uniref:B12-binding domain-containing radical SAM protein n=1 Tax=Desulfopila sp. IMCC35008 TaxID=2653858 RepID=UPI0013D05BC9|nr:cobalamin-dependent protein [Desulfopila sp. IMCC35008]